MRVTGGLTGTPGFHRKQEYKSIFLLFKNRRTVWPEKQRFLLHRPYGAEVDYGKIQPC